ncbi:MAG: small subunit ribosomal protein [Candidatus Woesearchaeota archaeon]|nr:small subunit ribosomal protein [Candidatus Woesearchaeota archaeon]MDK2908066.1 small subunit ribosomal protein [Candidatus Woesearchaeota archaeon]
MALNDPIADALSKILNAEKIGKKEVELYPVSNVLLQILDIFRKNRYVGEYKVEETTRGRIITLNLLGNINDCNSIKPRFPVTLKEFDKFEQRYLPAVDFGIIIITTSQGLMTLKEAREKKIGGRLLAYCY